MGRVRRDFRDLRDFLQNPGGTARDSGGRVKTYKYDDLLQLTRSILEGRLHYSAREALVTAKVLVEADARGIPSHGVSRLGFYRMNIDGGFAKPGAEGEVVHETAVSLVVDGHDGIGPYISDWAVTKLLEKARVSGAAFCAVRNSNHYGIAGFWAETIARYEMIGMAFTNTRTCGIPTFGRERVLGTNPIAVAIPCTEGVVSGDEFLLDMATTTVAHGKVEVYDRRKKAMPEGWAVDERGEGMTDATAFEKLFYANERYGGHLFLGGEGETSGGHKGYGLGLLVELLCSGLSLGASSLDTFRAGRGSGITHFFAALSLGLFGDATVVKRHVAEILAAIRGGETASGQNRIYIHGEKEAESRAAALRDGVPVDDATVEMLEKMRV
jgi:LDH2 family malate/lactate/ureidoglycolate dehydrogenase